MQVYMWPNEERFYSNSSGCFRVNEELREVIQVIQCYLLEHFFKTPIKNLAKSGNIQSIKIKKTFEFVLGEETCNAHLYIICQ